MADSKIPYVKQRVELTDRTLNLLQQPSNTVSTGTKVWSSSYAIQPRPVQSDPSAQVYVLIVLKMIFSRYRIIIAGWLEKNKSKLKVEGKRILEVGSGCGLGGFAFMLRGAEVTMTDVPEIMPLLKANLSANFSTDEVKRLNAQVVPYLWGEEPPAELKPPYDWVIGADVVYKLDLVEPLINSLVAMSDSMTKIVIAMEPRDPIVFDEFLAKCNEVFQVSRVRKTLMPDSEDSEWVHIYQMRLKD